MVLALWYHPILATLFGFVAIFLIIVILLQRGKGVGLAGAFGGAGGHTAFGSKTGDVLTWATVVIAGMLLLFAIVLNFAFRPPRPAFSVPPAQAPVTRPATPGSESGAGAGPGTELPAAPPGTQLPQPGVQTPPAGTPLPAETPTEGGAEPETSPGEPG